LGKWKKVFLLLKRAIFFTAGRGAKPDVRQDAGDVTTKWSRPGTEVVPLSRFGLAKAKE
jgi:hypothetical protein